MKMNPFDVLVFSCFAAGMIVIFCIAFGVLDNSYQSLVMMLFGLPAGYGGRIAYDRMRGI